MYCHFCFEFMNHGLIMLREVKVFGESQFWQSLYAAVSVK